MKNPQIFTKLVSPVRLLGQALSKTRKPGFSSVGKVEQRAHGLHLAARAGEVSSSIVNHL